MNQYSCWKKPKSSSMEHLLLGEKPSRLKIKRECGAGVCLRPYEVPKLHK